MNSHLLDLGDLFFGLSIWLLSFIGWGILTKNIIGLNHRLKFSDAWLGLVTAILLVEACNIWVPID